MKQFFRSVMKVGFVALVLIGVLAQSVQAATYNFSQTNWGGGTTANTAVHPTNMTNLTQYSSGTNIVGSSTSTTLGNVAATSTDSFTATTNEDVANTSATWDTTGSGNITSPVATQNLSSKFSGVLGAAAVTSVAYDPNNQVLYISSDAGQLVKYSYASGTSTDLTSAISSFWAGNKINKISFSTTTIYLVGNGGRFAKYDIGSGIATDLSSYIPAAASTTAMTAMTFDPVHGYVYLAGYKYFFKFDTNTNILTDLSAKLQAGTILIPALEYNAGLDLVYISGQYSYVDSKGTQYQDYLAKYTVSSNTVSQTNGSLGNGPLKLVGSVLYNGYFSTLNLVNATTLAVNGTVSTGATSYTGVDYDSTTQRLYFTSSNTTYPSVGYYDTVANTSTDLSSLRGSSTPGVTYASTNMVFVAGTGSWITQINPSVTVKYAQSLNINTLGQKITYATVTSNNTPGSGYVKYYVSNDGGATWNLATLGAKYNFATVGTDLRWKIELYNGATVQDITVNYGGYATSGSVVSEPYNTGDTNNQIGSVVWNINSLPTSTDAGVSIRTSPDNATWSAWQNFTTSTCQAGATTFSSQNFYSENSNTYVSSIGEYGVRYKTTASTTITGLRYYKYPVTGENGSHTLRLWDVNGNLLASAAVPDVSGTYGWYSVNLATPIQLPANTTFTVSGNILSRAALNTTVAANTSRAGLTAVYWYYSSTPGAYPTTDQRQSAYLFDPIYSYTPSSTYTCSGASIPAALKSNSQYFQYRVNMSSDGSYAPVVDKVQIQYVINVAPNFDTSYNTTGASATYSAGKVNITYKVRDTDTNTGTVTPGYVTPSFEYSLDGGSTWNAIGSQYLAAGDTSNKAVSTSAYNTYTATWNAFSQLGNAYSATTKVRVTVNDNEASNNTALAALPANFVLDTGAPTSSLKLDLSSGLATLNLSDNSSSSYSMVNGTTSGSSYTSFGTSLSTTTVWTFDSSRSVTVSAFDTYSNTTTITAVAPDYVKNMKVSSNVLSWTSYSNATGATFDHYDIYRNDNGAGYAALASSTSVTGSYTDATQVVGHTYLYRVRVVDADGDISQWAYPNYMSLNASSGTINFAFGSASNIQYRLSNGSDASIADGLNAISGQWQTVGANTTSGVKTWNFVNSGNPVVTAEVLDANGNDVIVTAVTPGMPSSFQVKDVSNQPIGLYQLFLSWGAYQNVSNANLQYYEIWRSVNGATSTLYATTTQNQYTDSNLSGQPYSYKVRTVDTDNDISVFTNAITLTPSVSPLSINVKPSVTATPSTAQVSWSTSDAANGTVFYATSTALLSTNPASSTNLTTSTSHTVNISGLNASTTYYYYVQSSDAYGQTATDNNSGLYYSFNTKPTFPIISAIATSTGPTSFTVTWTTNVAANSYVFYGTTSNLLGAPSVGSDIATTTHSVTVPNLSSNTDYYFYVKSTDVANQSVTDNNGGSNYVIHTQVAPLQVNVHPASSGVVYNSATIGWTTNSVANGTVFYATSTLGLSTSSASTTDNTSSTSHSINLTGLNASTTYYYFVQSVDGYGQKATDNNGGAFYSFTTQPPLNVISATSSTSTATSITVNWTTSLTSDSYVYYGTSQDLSLAPSLGSSAQTTNHSVLIPGLLSTTTYWYYIKSTDSLGRAVIDNNGGQNYSIVTQPGALQVMGNPQGAVATYNSATVTWTTNVPANGTVFYATSTALLGSAPSSSSDAATSTSHSVSLTGLNSSTTYWYYVQSTDQYGQVASDTNNGLYYSFTTKQVPLNIVNVTTTAKNYNSATIEWDTNRVGLSQVFYGTDLINAPGSFMGSFGTYSMQSGDNPYHFVATITGLNSSTTYYYYIQISDSQGETAQNDNTGSYYQFKTSPVLPSISSVTTSTTQTSLTVKWNTNVPTDGVVMYGTSTSALASSTPDSVTTSHTVTITGLTASTTYVFLIRSVDSLNQVALDDNGGQYYSADTKPYSFAIANVSAVAQDQQATVIWDTNYDSDSHVYYSTSTSTSSFVGVTGSTSYLGGANPYRHSATISGLQPGQLYYYYVTSVDANNTTAKDDKGGQYYTFTTTNTAPPSISMISVPTVTQNVATIKWQTNKPTTGQVAFGTSTGVYSSSVADQTLGVDHVATLTGLNASTTYYYVIGATDAGNNTASSTEQSFMTTAPVISDVQVDPQSITDNSVVITWNTSLSTDDKVYFSTDATMAASQAVVGTTTLATVHSVLVGGLTPGTQYYFFVQSNDGSNNYIDNKGGEYYTFTTTDTVPPVITNVSVPVVSSESAAIIWTTDKLADSLVEWGEIAGAPASSTSNASLFKNHIMTVSGLNASTTYYFTVSSRTPISRTAKSDEQSFSTVSVKTEKVYITQNPGGDVADKTPPTVSEVNVNPINSFDATVNFRTSKDTVGFVSYGTDLNYGLVAGDDQYKSAHAIKIKGLTMGSLYHFTVTAIDAAGNKTTSGDQTFSTKFFSEGQVTVDNAEQFQKDIEDAIASALPSIVPPFIEKPEVKDITENSATIAWRTNVPSYSVVGYSPDEQYAAGKEYVNKEVDLNNKVTAHEIKLSNLQPNTTYHFMAQSFRLPQVVGKGDDMTFVTAASKIQARVAEVKNSSFVVVWTTGEPTDSIVEYVNTKTGVTQRITESDKKTLHSMTLDNLSPGTAYKVTVSGYNDKGNLVQGAEPISVSTSQDVTPPKITNFKIDAALVPNRTDRAQAIISWKTDELANSVVYYDEGTGTTGDEIPKKKVEGGDNYMSDHTLIIPSLRPGSIYRFMVESTDQAGNKAQTPVRTVIIPRQAESIFDVIFKNFEDTFKFLRQAGQ